MSRRLAGALTRQPSLSCGAARLPPRVLGEVAASGLRT